MLSLSKRSTILLALFLAVLLAAVGFTVWGAGSGKIKSQAVYLSSNGGHLTGKIACAGKCRLTTDSRVYLVYLVKKADGTYGWGDTKYTAVNTDLNWLDSLFGGDTAQGGYEFVGVRLNTPFLVYIKPQSCGPNGSLGSCGRKELDYIGSEQDLRGFTYAGQDKQYDLTLMGFRGKIKLNPFFTWTSGGEHIALDTENVYVEYKINGGTIRHMLLEEFNSSQLTFFIGDKVEFRILAPPNFQPTDWFQANFAGCDVTIIEKEVQRVPGYYLR